MDEAIAKVIGALVIAAIVGLVGAVSKLWHDFNAHRLYVAEHYVRTPELTKLETVMADIQHQLAEILKTVHELKGAASAK